MKRNEQRSTQEIDYTHRTSCRGAGHEAMYDDLTLRFIPHPSDRGQHEHTRLNNNLSSIRRSMNLLSPVGAGAGPCTIHPDHSRTPGTTSGHLIIVHIDIEMQSRAWRHPGVGPDGAMCALRPPRMGC